MRDVAAFLAPGDLMVFNDTRVFPARLLASVNPGGGAVEVLLVSRMDDERWEALVHPGQRMRPGRRVRFERGGRTLHGEVLEERHYGRRAVRFRTNDAGTVMDAIEAIGHIPLPPVHQAPGPRPRPRALPDRVCARGRLDRGARRRGCTSPRRSCASLDAAGVERAAITLHVGYGTFKPVRAARRGGAHGRSRAIRDQRRRRVAHQRRDRRRAARDRRRDHHDPRAGVGGSAGRRARDGRRADTGLFIHPGHRFLVAGGLVTNFHLPASSLLMLVAAFGGRDRVLEAYREAVCERYRFYSYGDAMLVV